MTAGEQTATASRPGWLRFRFAYLLILAAVGLFAFKFTTKAWEAHQLGLQVAAEQSQLREEALNNRHLAREIRHFRTLSFVYQQARNWGYVRPGDRPIIVSVRYRSPPPRHIVHRSAAPPAPTWQQWWNAFFGSQGRHP